MPDNLNHDEVGQGGQQFQSALSLLKQIMIDGMRHGHFSCSITGCIRNEKKRELVIVAGKSYKFTIPEEELPS